MAELQNKEKQVQTILLTLSHLDDKNNDHKATYAIEFKVSALIDDTLNEIINSLKRSYLLRHAKFSHKFKMIMKKVIDKVNEDVDIAMIMKKIDKVNEDVDVVPLEFIEFVENNNELLSKKYPLMLPIIIKRVIDDHQTTISCHLCSTTLIRAEENNGKHRVLETQSCKHYVARQYDIKNKEDKKKLFEKLTSNDSKIVMMISENDKVTTIEWWDWE